MPSELMKEKWLFDFDEFETALLDYEDAETWSARKTTLAPFINSECVRNRREGQIEVKVQLLAQAEVIESAEKALKLVNMYSSDTIPLGWRQRCNLALDDIRAHKEKYG